MGICLGMYLLLGMLFILYRNKKDSLKRYKGLIDKIFVLLLCVTTLAAVLESAKWVGEQPEGSLRIERNGYGGGKKDETLYMQVEGENQEEVRVQVSPRDYSREEIQQLFHQAMDVLEEEIPGENETVDHVIEDLNLPSEIAGFPFTISWELSRYDVMDMTGRLKTEALREKDPFGEGILVTLTGVLRYGSEESKFCTEVRVFSKTETEAGIKERVLDLVKEADELEKEKPYLELPQSIDGKTIMWEREKVSHTAVLLLLGMVGSILLVCEEKQKAEQRRKERNEQMLLDYPELISQFTMLMDAGMTAKSVWEKVAEDYREQRARTGRKRYAYEEILYTWKEMLGGIPEAECYERFSKRCELLPYMKLGVLLAQNLKKGAKGVAQMLRMESVQAMEERKSRARRMGEEAGTKLLMPMLLMLVIVLMIVVVPAFFSIQL